MSGLYSRQKPKQILIVDLDRKYLESIKSDPKALEQPPLLAWTGKAAQQTIARNTQQIAGLFLNSNVITPEGGPNAISVIRFFRQHAPSVPIYLISDGKCPLSEQDVSQFGIRDSLLKPVLYTRMLELVAPDLIKFDPDSVSSSPKGEKDSLGQETDADDSEFCSVRATDFVSGSKVLFHLYIRIGSRKFIKLLHSGDAFSPERLAVYLKKGIEFFYLRKEDQQQYLAFCKQMASAVVSKSTVASAAKASQTMNYGQETLNFLRSQGLSSEHLHHASSFIENVHTYISKVNVVDNALFKNFLSNFAGYEHGVSTTMVTSLVSKVSGIESASGVQIIGIASLLHDIGLYQLSPEVHAEDESKMTQEQIKAFRTHPKLGAAMLSKIPGTHPSVIQAVLQHHERRGKKGFSSNDRVKSINRVAEIIGIADEYLLMIPKAKADPSFDIKQELETVVFPSFSSAVVDAFRSVFCKVE